METVVADEVRWTVNRVLQEAGQLVTVADQQQQTTPPPVRDFDVWDSFISSFNNSTGSGTGSLHPAADVEVSAVVTALGFNVTIFVIVIVVYEVCFRFFPSVYRSNSANLEGGIKIPKSPLPLSWVPAIMRVSWGQVRKMCGLDSYMFLRYIRMCFQVTAVSGLWGMVILWPIFATGGNQAHGWYYFSMANIVTGSWRLWFPTIFIWLLTLYITYTMNEEYKHFVECRMEFLAKGDIHVPSQQRYSLLVEEIPRELRSDSALKEYFDRLFPGKVQSAALVLNVPDLDELCTRRDRVVKRLEKCVAIREATGRKPVHRVGTHKYLDVRGNWILGRKPVDLHDEDERLPKLGEKVDSIQYYTKYLEILNEKVAAMQGGKLDLAQRGEDTKRASEWISQTLGLGSSRSLDVQIVDDGALIVASGTPSGLPSNILTLIRKAGFDFLIGGLSNLNRPLNVVVDTLVGTTLSSTGFVTFTDLVTLTSAVRAPLTHEAGGLSVTMAPDPRDIIWHNAHVNQTWRAGREWTANMFLALGAILWSIPVTGIQALANLSQIARLPGLAFLTDLMTEDFIVFANGYLPVLALILLIAMLPFIFHYVALRYEHRKEQSDIDNSIVMRSFYYQLANVYVTLTAGSILDSLAEILDHPSNAFALLGKSVPSVVGYFVMFVLTKLLAGLPFVLLRGDALLARLLGGIFCNSRFMTQRELDEAEKPVPLNLGREYPNQLLLIVVMFTYATISPVILPFGALYFLGALLVYKKQLLLVYASSYESGGKMFPTACRRTLIGLVCGQITLIGYTVLRLGFYQPMVLLPLPVYTISMMGSFEKLYVEPGNHLSLQRAIELDRQRNIKEQFGEDIYRQPALNRDFVEPVPYRRQTDTGSEKVV